MKKPFVFGLIISIVWVLNSYAIQIGPTEKCSKISTVLYKTFVTSNNEVVPVEIKLVTEDRRGEDLDVFARHKHYELCDVFFEKLWNKKQFQVQ